MLIMKSEERAHADWRQRQLLSFQTDRSRQQRVSMPCIYIYTYIILLSLKTKATALLKIFLDGILDTFPDHPIVSQRYEKNQKTSQFK